MKPDIRYIWAKTDREAAAAWHTLLLHILHVAASAEAILGREPDSTLPGMAQVLGMEWSVAKPWILIVNACHELGKASPAFQKKWLEGHGALMQAAGLRIHPFADASKN